MHVIERFHRRDFGHLDHEITFDDPITARDLRRGASRSVRQTSLPAHLESFKSPTEVALLRSGPAGDDYRHIFMDGRELPKDPNPTWRGYSVGQWEGDTLVVETAGFNDLDLPDNAIFEMFCENEKDAGHIK
jgi:hypothetical protein